MSQIKIFIYLPCYNEGENIATLIGRWLSHIAELSKLGYEQEIIGIDDCSADNTKSIIAEKSKEHQSVSLISHERNRGLCGGLNTAISDFFRRGNSEDLMVLMDGDDTHNPKYVFDMIRKLTKDIDCVIASRYCDDSGVVGVASYRKFLSDGARLFYKFMLRVPNVEDYTCGYRIYKYNIIKKMINRFGEEPIKEKSFACMMELLYKIYLSGAKFDEVGFELRYDYKRGESKMRVIKTIKNSIITASKLRKLYGQND